MAVGDVVVANPTGECTNYFDTTASEDSIDFPCVTTNFLLTEYVDLVRVIDWCVVQANHMFEYTVVGYVVSGGLAYSLVALA
mgnify:CR=1 FL=1